MEGRRRKGKGGEMKEKACGATVRFPVISNVSRGEKGSDRMEWGRSCALYEFFVWEQSLIL